MSHPAKKTIFFFLSESGKVGGQAVIARTRRKHGLHMRTVSPVPDWLGPGIDPVKNDTDPVKMMKNVMWPVPFYCRVANFGFSVNGEDPFFLRGACDTTIRSLFL